MYSPQHQGSPQSQPYYGGGDSNENTYDDGYWTNGCWYPSQPPPQSPGYHSDYPTTFGYQYEHSDYDTSSSTSAAHPSASQYPVHYHPPSPSNPSGGSQPSYRRDVSIDPPPHLSSPQQQPYAHPVPSPYGNPGYPYYPPHGPVTHPHQATSSYIISPAGHQPPAYSPSQAYPPPVSAHRWPDSQYPPSGQGYAPNQPQPQPQPQPQLPQHPQPQPHPQLQTQPQAHAAVPAVHLATQFQQPQKRPSQPPVHQAQSPSNGTPPAFNQRSPSQPTNVYHPQISSQKRQENGKEDTGHDRPKPSGNEGAKRKHGDSSPREVTAPKALEPKPSSAPSHPPQATTPPQGPPSPPPAPQQLPHHPPHPTQPSASPTANPSVAVSPPQTVFTRESTTTNRHSSQNPQSNRHPGASRESQRDNGNASSTHPREREPAERRNEGARTYNQHLPASKQQNTKGNNHPNKNFPRNEEKQPPQPVEEMHDDGEEYEEYEEDYYQEDEDIEWYEESEFEVPVDKHPHIVFLRGKTLSNEQEVKSLLDSVNEGSSFKRVLKLRDHGKREGVFVSLNSAESVEVILEKLHYGAKNYRGQPVCASRAVLDSPSGKGFNSKYGEGRSSYRGAPYRGGYPYSQSGRRSGYTDRQSRYWGRSRGGGSGGSGYGQGADPKHSISNRVFMAGTNVRDLADKDLRAILRNHYSDVKYIHRPQSNPNGLFITFHSISTYNAVLATLGQVDWRGGITIEKAFPKARMPFRQ